jgi:signal transduction histidine kinase
MYVTHPAFPSRRQARALAIAEQRDEADLQTLDAITAILRDTLAALRALPDLRHPDPTYCLGDTIVAVADELKHAVWWASHLRNNPTEIDPDEREWEWTGDE